MKDPTWIRIDANQHQGWILKHSDGVDGKQNHVLCNYVGIFYSNVLSQVTNVFSGSVSVSKLDPICCLWHRDAPGCHRSAGARASEKQVVRCLCGDWVVIVLIKWLIYGWYMVNLQIIEHLSPNIIFVELCMQEFSKFELMLVWKYSETLKPS